MTRAPSTASTTAQYILLIASRKRCFLKWEGTKEAIFPLMTSLYTQKVSFLFFLELFFFTSLLFHPFPQLRGGIAIQHEIHIYYEQAYRYHERGSIAKRQAG